MEPNRTLITPLRFCILAIRLVALFMFFSSLSYVGYLLNAVVNRGPWSDAVAGPQAAILVVYVIVLMILLRYPEPIARVLSRGVPRIGVRSRWTRVDLLAAIIAGVAAYEILSSIPAVFSQLYGLLTHYASLTEEGAAEKERFNLLVVGICGTALRIGISGFVFVKSGQVAVLWDQWQTTGELRKRGK
jgi:hypothetical protein